MGRRIRSAQGRIDWRGGSREGLQATATRNRPSHAQVPALQPHVQKQQHLQQALQGLPKPRQGPGCGDVAGSYGDMLNGLDLFSGIGGLSLALAPWVRPVAYCEIDSYCQGVLLSRFVDGQLPPAPIFTKRNEHRGGHGPERQGKAEPRHDGEEGALADADSERECQPDNETSPERDGWTRAWGDPFRRGWWAVEPDMGRVAHGILRRVDRLRALGNAVVPACAREAFQRLSGLEVGGVN